MMNATVDAPAGPPSATVMDAVSVDADRGARHGLIRTYVSVVLVGVAGIAIASVKAIIIGTYEHDFGTSAPVAGYLLSMEMVAATLGVILSALLGGKTPLAAALIAIFVADVGTAFATAVPMLFAWQILAGLGHGFALGRMGQGIATVDHPQRLTGCYTITYLALSSVNSFFLPDIKALFGSHALFFTLALTGPLALLALRWFPEVDPRAAHRVTGGSRSAGFVVTLVTMLAFLLWYLGIGGFWPFVGQFGAHAGISFDERTRILGSAQLFGLIGASISLVVGNRFGTFKPLACFVSLQTVAVIVLIVGAGNSTAFMIAAWLYVFAWLGGFPNQLGLLSKLDPTGRLNALSYVMGNIAYAVGPAGVGLLLKSAPSEGAGLGRLQYSGLALLVVSGSIIVSLAYRLEARRGAGVQ